MRKVIVKHSKVSGKGLFAKTDIKKNEFIIMAEGAIIKYPPNFGFSNGFGKDWLGVGINAWLIPHRKNLFHLINHSCNPNSGIIDKVKVCAMRNIKKGEEITIDYSITEADPNWKMTCHCKEKNCRKIIRSIQFLPEKLYKQYNGFIPKFLKEAHKKQKTYLKAFKGIDGVYAKKALKKNEEIFICKGPIIKYPTPPDYRVGYKWLNIAHNVWIMPYRNNPWSSLKHSCSPNVGLKGKNKVVAMKNVRKNEELTIDNSITEAEISWRMKCNCGKKNCRKIIKSVQFLPKKLFKKYQPFIPEFLQKQYLKANS